MAKVKVRVTQKFKDSKNDLVIREVGEELEVSTSRAKVLIASEVAEEVIEQDDEEAVEQENVNQEAVEED